MISESDLRVHVILGAVAVCIRQVKLWLRMGPNNQCKTLTVVDADAFEDNLWPPLVSTHTKSSILDSYLGRVHGVDWRRLKGGRDLFQRT